MVHTRKVGGPGIQREPDCRPKTAKTRAHHTPRLSMERLLTCCRSRLLSHSSSTRSVRMEIRPRPGRGGARGVGGTQNCLPCGFRLKPQKKRGMITLKNTDPSTRCVNNLLRSVAGLSQAVGTSHVSGRLSHIPKNLP